METLVLLSFLSILIFFIVIHKQRKNRAKLPPGPPHLPLIGNLHQFDNSTAHSFLWQLSKLYGPIIALRLGSKPTVVVSSAKLAREVLKTHDLKFASRPPLVALRKLSYNGLDLGFAPYGPYFREMKKLCVQHLFSSHRVQSFRSIREHEVAQMIRKISQHEASGTVVNLTETLMSFTNSLICRIAFGKKYGYEYEEVEVGSKRSKLQGLLNEAQALLTEFYFSDYIPLLGWVDRFRGILWRLDKIFKELDAFYDRVIGDHMGSGRVNSKNSEHDVEDIVDILLQLLNDRSFSLHLTLDHIKAVLMNIFIAGTDPSSATIVWAMTALLRNPKAMKKVKEEVRNVLGDKDFINEDDIERLSYLKAVVKETLRLFPPSPLLLPRETMERCKIGGYEIEPKTLVYVNAWGIARDPENWENPQEFCPERFLGSCVELKGNEFELIPFGYGRRMCPGKHMALVNVELSVANLIHTFDWELPQGILMDEMLDTEVKPGITMHKKRDLFLVPKKSTI
ncbi:cytochrome P450 83B1-like [Abrus precatorius]|uniref:Cytochrome P450 83B1-like n=1 Tax=Abrus precatorius TaxID=3816 RepID=A0A8B8JGE0_ABRPR|nr:cytochrome P450 83B1-like [Abrus precatorius]XP_027330521.1 cytochrome P450 83B1-like [Abrus precatorius]